MTFSQRLYFFFSVIGWLLSLRYHYQLIIHHEFIQIIDVGTLMEVSSLLDYEFYIRDTLTVPDAY